jgi:hypothetical protein
MFLFTLIGQQPVDFRTLKKLSMLFIQIIFFQGSYPILPG